MTRNTSERVALVDMDGTTADFNGQLDRDLETMREPLRLTLPICTERLLQSQLHSPLWRIPYQT